ncbi:MAG: hypothetical protein R2932_03940 [Caldilineaceae bacterium]
MGWLSTALMRSNPCWEIPSELDVLAIIPFGYPTKSIVARGRKDRKPFDKVVYFGRFDDLSVTGCNRWHNLAALSTLLGVPLVSFSLLQPSAYLPPQH